MAHVEIRQTNSSVVTFVRGRVYRNDPKPTTHTLHNRTQVKAVRRRRICVLSHFAGKQLENWYVSQPCHGPKCHHSHHTREEVEKMVRDGELRWVGQGENVAAWRRPRYLAVRQSGPVTCVQLVED